MRYRHGFLALALPFVAVVMVACAPSEPISPKAIVDLSPTIGEDAAVRAVGRKFLQQGGFRETTTFHHTITETPIYTAMSYIEVFNHVGPHHDPPNHIIKSAKSTDKFPLDHFFGRAIVLDFRMKPKDEPLTVEDFRGRRIQPGDIVIAFVGYIPPTSDDELPSYAYLSGEAAEYLATLPIKAFATDMPGLVGFKNYMKLHEQGLEGSEAFLPEHYAFLSRDIPAVEGLVNLEGIVNERDVIFVGFPLKIKDGNGGPMRAAALVY